MIDITGWVSAYVDKLRPLLMQYRMYLLVLLAIPIVTTTYEDYCEWYKLGAGGIPHNFLGYVIQLMLSFLTGRDRRSIAWLDSPKNTELDKTSFLNTTLPTREGDRPTIGPYCVPHRQTTDAASEELKKVSLCALAIMVDSVRALKLMVFFVDLTDYLEQNLQRQLSFLGVRFL